MGTNDSGHEESTPLIKRLWVMAFGAAAMASVAGCAGSPAAGSSAAPPAATASSTAATQGALPWWIVWGDAPAGSSQKYTVFEGSKQNIYAGDSQYKISGPYHSEQAAYNAAQHNGHGANPNYLTEPVIQTSYGPVSGNCLTTLRSYSKQQLKQVEQGYARPSECAGVKNGALLDGANDIGQQKWQSWP